MRDLSRSAVILVVLMGCGAGQGTDAPPAPMREDAGLAFPLATVRRPARRYYFERTEHRCAVYSVDRGLASARATFPCPEDLRDGERIRLVGKTCTRESEAGVRREPVVCPEPLTKLEERARSTKP